MAYLAFNPNEQDPNQQLQAQPQQQLGGGGAANPNGGQGQQAPQQDAPAGQNSFANIQQLLNKNQSAPNVAGDVVNQQTQAQDQQKDQVGQIQQQTQAPGEWKPQEAGKADFNALSTAVNAKYQGPQAGSINVAPQNLNQLNQQSNALRTQEGQQSLLKQQYDKSDYTAGQQRFDSLLQGRNSQFQQQAAQAQNQNRQLNEQTGNQNEALNHQAEAAKSQVDSNRKAALDYGTSESDNARKGLTDKAAQFNKEEMDRANGVDLTGLDVGNGRDLYTDEGLKKFAHYDPGMMANEANVDPEQAKYFNSIQKAIGGTGSIDPAAQAAQHGKYSFDQDAMNRANQSYQAEYDRGLGDYTNQVHNIYQGSGGDASLNGTNSGMLNIQGNALLGQRAQNAFTLPDSVSPDVQARYQALAQQAGTPQDALTGAGGVAKQYLDNFSKFQDMLNTTKSKYGRK